MALLETQLERVLSNRTRWLTVVVEELYQPHNALAVLRACESFGVQDLHIVSARNRFPMEGAEAQRLAQRLSLYRYESSERGISACLSSLKEQGYRIAATSLRQGCLPLAELDLTQKVALCFGTELEGLSDTAHDWADCLVRIPMYGFTQSLNISVSASLALFELSAKLREQVAAWRLSEGERAALRQVWREGEP